MIVRQARFDDVTFVYALSQDPSVRATSVRSESFTFEQHLEWWMRRFYDVRQLIFIGEADGGHGHHVAVAYLRYGWCGPDECDHEGPSAEIAVAVHPAFRGRGHARELLTRTGREGQGDLIALVLPENEASKALFAGAGFILEGGEERLGRQLLRYRKAYAHVR